MKKLFSRYCILFFVLAMLTLVGANLYASDLSALLNSLKSMKADFTQTIYDNHGKAIQKSYGQMALQRPGKFRWDVTKPIPQLIVANDNRLWIYDRDLQQVTIRSLKKAAGEAPALLLSQVNAELENNYNIKELQQEKGSMQWFLLTPKDANRGMLASTQIGFQGNEIREMRLKDNLDHTTSIQFQHIKTNTNLPDSFFVFKSPKGVDIIDENRRKK
jgi:outer membrane lipoprotein carrier protein